MSSFKNATDAITKGELDTLKQLLHEEPELTSVEMCYDETMESAETPSGFAMAPIIGTLLSLACKYGRLEAVQVLIDKGADVDSRETIHWHGAAASRRSALCLAVWGGHAEIVSLLLERHAAVDDPSGNSAATLLEEAADRGFTDIVRALLDARADVEESTGSDAVLCRAISGQHRDIVELLLDRGAKANANGSDGSSPLQVAVRSNAPDIVRLLLAKGADAGKDLHGDMSLLSITASTKGQLAEFVDGTSPGLERDWRARVQEQHGQLVELLLDSGALQVAPGSPEHVLALFKEFDQNGDGVIQYEELVQLLQRLDATSWTEERINQLLLAADINRDGQIQFDEFLTWVFGKGDDADAMRAVAEQLAAC